MAESGNTYCPFLLAVRFISFEEPTSHLRQFFYLFDLDSVIYQHYLDKTGLPLDKKIHQKYLLASLLFCLLYRDLKATKPNGYMIYNYNKPILIKRNYLRQLLFSIGFLIISYNTFGTAQIPDILIYKGDTLSLFSCPLYSYPNQDLVSPKNMFGSKGCFYTSCWRNYIATWEIVDNKLFLINIRNACYPADGKYVAVSYKEVRDTIGREFADLKSLFPDKFKNGKVFADWVSEKIISPKGKLLFYIHDGFESIFEKEIEFTIENGMISSLIEINNSKTRQSKYTTNDKLLINFIQSNIDYTNVPEPSDKIKVVVRVISANDEGKIDSVTILRGFNEIYDREALRVVKLIPDWDVIYRHGKKFNIPWMIPVLFEPKKE
jgi:hypothetical protein